MTKIEMNIGQKLQFILCLMKTIKNWLYGSSQRKYNDKMLSMFLLMISLLGFIIESFFKKSPTKKQNHCRYDQSFALAMVDVDALKNHQ